MDCAIFHSIRFVCSALIACVCVLLGSAMSQGAPVRLDSSDWWSYTRQEELPPREPLRLQRREPAETNFQIAGLELGTPHQDFPEIRSKFGEGTEVERGDGASSRKQTCYTSRSGSVHLIFEFGEVNSVLYLFEDGPQWNGSELCTPSETVSASMSTASGLRLGMALQQVRNILGDPNIARSEKLVYYFGYKKKTSTEALAQLRKSNPNMSDAEFGKNFEYVDGEVYIEARFASGRLNYLAISKSETY